MNENNLIQFIEEKVNNFKSLVISLWNNKEKMKEYESKAKNDKARFLLGILFLNDENKKKYIDDLMKSCEIDNNEDNYWKIEEYFNMFLEIKKDYFKD